MHLLPDEIVAVAWGERESDHLEQCPRCREEVDTIRQLNTALAAARRATRPWRLAGRRGLGLAATVAAVLAGVLVYRASGPARPPEPGPRVTSPASTTPAPEATVRAPVPKPAVVLLAGRALTLRGPGGDAYLRSFGEAIEPYRRDDFALAARRLEALAEGHPRAWEAHFYLGVSRLLQGQAREAVAPLTKARALAPDDPALLALTDGYLSAARERAGPTGAP